MASFSMVHTTSVTYTCAMWIDYSISSSISPPFPPFWSKFLIDYIYQLAVFFLWKIRCWTSGQADTFCLARCSHVELADELMAVFPRSAIAKLWMMCAMTVCCIFQALNLMMPRNIFSSQTLLQFVSTQILRLSAFKLILCIHAWKTMSCHS